MNENKIYVYEYLSQTLENLRNNELKDFLANKKTINFDFYDLQIYNNDKNKFQNALDIVTTSKLDNKIRLTSQQIEILSILNDDNIFISAPTSFGKTFIILEYIKRNTKILNNIVLIVPTIALMNELLKKIYFYFSNIYNICINSFEDVKEKNIFIFVPERSDKKFIEGLREKNIDLLVFDEIYKLKANSKGDVTKDDRLILMNKVYLQLLEKSKKIVLLGPFIKEINFNQTNIDIVKYYTNYMPIYNNVYEYDEKLWYKKIGNEKTLVYFNKPENIYKSINLILNNIKVNSVYEKYYNDEINYLKNEIDKDWYVIELLKRGIGIHHGKTPIYLRKFYENEYNNGNINTILCTNTLMEGINTPTNNLLIIDDTRDTFELNNLMGRVGRLNPQNPKIGNIFICNKKAFEKYSNSEEWLNLTILAENEEVFTNDEILFLNKNQKNEKKLNEYNEKLRIIEETGITVEKLKEYDICFDKVYKFITNDYIKKFIEAQKIYDCISLSLDVIGKQISKKFKISEFINLQSDIQYLPYKIYINKLIDKVPIREIVLDFNNNYLNTNLENTNLFIDRLFELSSYIKFTLSKITNYLSLFSIENETEIISKYVNLISSFSEMDNKSKILNDLGIEEKDCKYLSTFIKDDEYLSTSNVIKIIKRNTKEIFKSNISPFTKHNISNL